jgi:carboxypeptidase Taq
MYEQAVSAALDGTPLGQGVSAGVHESQSRLWENVVGHGRGFWEYFYPRLQRTFAEQLSRVPLAAFHRAINKVARSLIRTEADELTYNLHIMLRFDLELKMLEGQLRVRDLPEAWHAAMQADLGIAPFNDRDGCLQDSHWYSGYIGGRFQSYAIGNILSAQFYAAALKAHPGHPARNYQRRIWDVAHLATRQPLPARQQVRAERSRRAGNRRGDAHEVVF